MAKKKVLETNSFQDVLTFNGEMGSFLSEGKFINLFSFYSFSFFIPVYVRVCFRLCAWLYVF